MSLFEKKNNNSNTHTQMQKSLKIGFAQISLAAQKIKVAQILVGPLSRSQKFPRAYITQQCTRSLFCSFNRKSTDIYKENYLFKSA